PALRTVLTGVLRTPNTECSYEVLYLHDRIQLRNRPPRPPDVRLRHGSPGQETGPHQYQRKRFRVLPWSHRRVSAQPDDLLRMHVRLVLAARFLPASRPEFRPGPCPLSQGHSRRQKQERPHRFGKTGAPAAFQPHPPSLRLSRRKTAPARAAAPADLLRLATHRAAQSHSVPSTGPQSAFGSLHHPLQPRSLGKAHLGNRNPPLASTGPADRHGYGPPLRRANPNLGDQAGQPGQGTGSARVHAPAFGSGHRRKSGPDRSP